MAIASNFSNQDCPKNMGQSLAGTLIWICKNLNDVSKVEVGFLFETFQGLIFFNG